MLLASIVLLGGCATTPAEPPTAAAEPTPFNVLGREDAPVTIIEFTDLQCPYCARFATQTFPRLKHDYIETGKLRYSSMDFPLPFHDFALPAAIASRCAGEQGRFWDYREALFAAQATLGTLGAEVVKHCEQVRLGDQHEVRAAEHDRVLGRLVITLGRR